MANHGKNYVLVEDFGTHISIKAATTDEILMKNLAGKFIGKIDGIISNFSIIIFDNETGLKIGRFAGGSF